MKKCQYCGQFIDDYSTVCPNCHQQQPPVYTPGSQPNNYGNSYNQGFNLQEYYNRNNCFDSGPEGKSRGVAGLLAIFLGGLGVQYFYLNKIGGGFLTILLTFVTCGLWEVVTLIQGILMLCMDNRSFREKYVLSNSTLPLF